MLTPWKKKFEELDCNIEDNENGTYKASYKIADPGEVEVQIWFEDDKGNMVQIRGSPFVASFTNEAKPSDNLMSGTLM